MRFQPLVLGAFVLALTACGCGGAKKLVKVRGTVLMNGAPLENAGVTFFPESGDGPEATGITRSDGTFDLMTYSPGDGARPGDYKVIVQKVDEHVESAPQPLNPKDPASAKSIYVKRMTAKKKPEKAKSLIHPVYSDRARTFLKCRVPPDGPVLFEVGK